MIQASSYADRLLALMQTRRSDGGVSLLAKCKADCGITYKPPIEFQSPIVIPARSNAGLIEKFNAEMQGYRDEAARRDASGGDGLLSSLLTAAVAQKQASVLVSKSNPVAPIATVVAAQAFYPSSSSSS